MDRKMKVFVSLVILILIGLAFYLVSYLITKYTGYSITGKIVYSKEEKIQIGKCLSEKGVVLYCSNLALNCLRQKKILDVAFEHINYVECTENFEDCRNLNLPAWKINNEFYFGIRDLGNLADATGCKVR